MDEAEQQPDNQGESSDKTADDDVECEDSYCAGYAVTEGDEPFSHLEIVCRTIFNLAASSSCESPFDFLIALMFSLNIRDNLISFSC